MKLENQVCTLRQAKKLKKLLGAGNASLFEWMHVQDQYKEKEPYYTLHQPAACYMIEKFPAFTASEILIMLPSNPEGRDWYMRHNWKGISFGYNGRNAGLPHIEQKWFKQNQMAEAMADLLILMIETDVLTVEEINKSLISDPS